MTGSSGVTSAGLRPAMFILAPSTRFGYFIYPAAMVLWLLVSQAGRKSAEVTPLEPVT